MERVLAIVKSFPPNEPAGLNDQLYDEHIQSYCTTLNGLKPKDQAVILSNAGIFLQSLDPKTHTVGYAYILDVLLQEPSQLNLDRNVLTEKIFDFITNFDGRQMRYAGQYYRRLTDMIGSGKIFSVSSLRAKHTASWPGADFCTETTLRSPGTRQRDSPARPQRICSYLYTSLPAQDSFPLWCQ
jgi:hypothetical protein